MKTAVAATALFSKGTVLRSITESTTNNDNEGLGGRRERPLSDLSPATTEREYNRQCIEQLQYLKQRQQTLMKQRQSQKQQKPNMKVGLMSSPSSSFIQTPINPDRSIDGCLPEQQQIIPNMKPKRPTSSSIASLATTTPAVSASIDRSLPQKQTILSRDTQPKSKVQVRPTSANISSRLYEEGIAMKSSKEARTAQLKQEAERKVMSSCTFAPSLTKKAQQLSQQSHTYLPIEDKTAIFMQRKVIIEAKGQEERLAKESKDCTFQPDIYVTTKKNTDISDKARQASAMAVYDKQLEWQKRVQAKNEDRKKHMLELELAEHQPMMTTAVLSNNQSRNSISQPFLMPIVQPIRNYTLNIIDKLNDKLSSSSGSKKNDIFSSPYEDMKLESPRVLTAKPHVTPTDLPDPLMQSPKDILNVQTSTTYVRPSSIIMASFPLKADKQMKIGEENKAATMNQEVVLNSSKTKLFVLKTLPGQVDFGVFSTKKPTNNSNNGCSGTAKESFSESVSEMATKARALKARFETANACLASRESNLLQSPTSNKGAGAPQESRGTLMESAVVINSVLKSLRGQSDK